MIVAFGLNRVPQEGKLDAIRSGTLGARGLAVIHPTIRWSFTCTS